MSATNQEHQNNFGFARLLFAAFVIVSHTSEILDGSRINEPLVSLIGSRSLGDVAVDGFFLISGYLIVKSAANSTSIASYLKKRILRIYPGYIAAYLICILILAPLTSHQPKSENSPEIINFIKNLVGLQGPQTAGFIGLPYETLNGSLWTISYEFRCYIFAACLSAAGLLKQPRTLLLITIALIVASLSGLAPHVSGRTAFFIGDPSKQLRLLTTFCVGGSFYLLGPRIQLTNLKAALCAIPLIAAMLLKTGEWLAFSLFGGYLLFWFALQVKSIALSRVGSRHDASYGTYLYGWPICSSLVYFLNFHSQTFTTIVTLILSYMAGLLSWSIVEKRFIQPQRVRPNCRPAPSSHLHPDFNMPPK